MALTQQIVDDAPAKETWLSDGKGLLLRTTAKGGKAWYHARSVNGKRVREKIGNACEMSLFEAREVIRLESGKPSAARDRVRQLEDRIVALEAVNAEQYRNVTRLTMELASVSHRYNSMLDRLLAVGIQPTTTDGHVVFGFDEERRLTSTVLHPEGAELEPAAVPTFAEYAAKWIERNRGAWSDATRKGYESKLRNHALPRIGDVEMGQLTSAALAEVANAVGNGTRSQLLVCLRGACDLAFAEGVVADDIAGKRLDALLVRERVSVNHRKALAVEDAPAFYQSLDDSQGAKALRLVMLTAVRINAVAVGDVADVDGDTWTPAPERQAGRGKETPRVPLSTEAQACVAALGTGRTTIKKHTDGKPFDVHGMRSTFRQWCQREGVPFETAEHALGHKIGNATTRAYERDDLLEQRREVMQRWADFLTGSVQA